MAKSDTGNGRDKGLDEGGYRGLKGEASALLCCVPTKYLFLCHELMRYGCDGAPALAVKSAFTDIEAGHNGMVGPPDHSSVGMGIANKASAIAW